MPRETLDEHTIRLDKWLWAARFFKTRSLASQAVVKGHVLLANARSKASYCVKAGDQLSIRRGESTCTIIVKALSAQRGPASIAAQLYEETAESITLRQQQALEKKMQPRHTGPRPTKRERRQLDHLKKS